LAAFNKYTSTYNDSCGTASVGTLPSIATVERHLEPKASFSRKLDWHPASDEESLIQADCIVIKHGDAPSPETIDYLSGLQVERALVCGLQSETCCRAAGFASFDAGLQPRLITDLTAGSSQDWSGALGVRLWEHHFRHTVMLGELHRI